MPNIARVCSVVPCLRSGWHFPTSIPWHAGVLLIHIHYLRLTVVLHVEVLVTLILPELLIG